MQQVLSKVRHIFSLMVVLGLLGAYTLFTQPVTAQALSIGCTFINSLTNVHTLIGFPLNAGEVVSVYIYSVAGTPTQATLSVDGVPMGTTNVPGTVSATISITGTTTLSIAPDAGSVLGNWTCGLSAAQPSKKQSNDGPPAMNLLDGRVNNAQGLDVAAPVAIYAGSINIYGIDPATGAGSLDVQISDEQIEAAGVPADAPVLLGQGKNAFTGIDIYVYRLSTGEFHVNTHYADGKPYIFLWTDSGEAYHAAW